MMKVDLIVAQRSFKVSIARSRSLSGHLLEKQTARVLRCFCLVYLATHRFVRGNELMDWGSRCSVPSAGVRIGTIRGFVVNAARSFRRLARERSLIRPCKD